MDGSSVFAGVLAKALENYICDNQQKVLNVWKVYKQFIDFSHNCSTQPFLSLLSLSNCFTWVPRSCTEQVTSWGFFCTRADFPKDFSPLKPDTPLWASCPLWVTVKTAHLPCPAAGRSPENQLSVALRWTWKWKCCCASQHRWPVATGSWSTSMQPLSMRDPRFILRATGSWRGQEVKWPKTAMLGSFCQYWLLFRCSGWKGLERHTQNSINFLNESLALLKLLGIFKLS